MTRPARRRGGDIGDVVGIDQRVGDAAGGQGGFAGHHRGAQRALAEILCEPGGAHQRVGKARSGHDRRAESGAVLAPARQAHEAVDPGGAGAGDEAGDAVGRSGGREIGMMADIDGAGSVERRRCLGRLHP